MYSDTIKCTRILSNKKAYRRIEDAVIVKHVLDLVGDNPKAESCAFRARAAANGRHSKSSRAVAFETLHLTLMYLNLRRPPYITIPAHEVKYCFDRCWSCLNGKRCLVYVQID